MIENKDLFKSKLKKLIIGFSIAFVILITYYIIRETTSFSIPCLFHLLTNKNCPSCGMTRMFTCMLQFNFAEAMTYNYFLFFTLPIIIFIVVAEIRKYLLCQKHKKWYVILCLAYIGCSLIWGIIRNIYGI